MWNKELINKSSHIYSNNFQQKDQDHLVGERTVFFNNDISISIGKRIESNPHLIQYTKLNQN